MSLDWMNVKELSFNVLLLLERVQLSWFPGWVPEEALATALQANPAVAWYVRHKCPEIAPWVEELCNREVGANSPEKIRNAELEVMSAINDLLVYVVDPAIYDNLPFLGWDDRELQALVDFQGKRVIDVGAGTGRLTFVAAQSGARAVFAVEPVENLRSFIKDKARKRGLRNVFPVDGLITQIPFPEGFADVSMGGHVFGDTPQREFDELLRVTRSPGMLILCPGSNDPDEGWHDFLVERGCQWSRFEEPGEGWKRKYWKHI